MRAQDTNAEDAQQIALRALVWTLADPPRAMRLLDVTGLAPADLRTRIGEPAVLAAAIGFLEGHEPDLIACAESLGLSPAALVAARHDLETA